jgi:hypothetical protein
MDPKAPNPQPDPAIQAELAKLKKEIADVGYLRKELAAVKAQVSAGGAGGTAIAVPVKDVQDRLDRLTNPVVPSNGRLSKSLRMPSRLSRPDELATAALREVAKAYPSGQKNAQKFIQDHKLESAVGKLSSSLLGSGTLDEMNRLLLSDPDVYGAVLLDVLEQAKNTNSLDKIGADKEGFRISVLSALEADSGPRERFTVTIAQQSLKRSGVTIDPANLTAREKRFIAALSASGIPLTDGRVEGFIEAAYERVLADGDYPALVDAFVEFHEIDPNKFTADIRASMVRHLINRGVKIDLDDPDQKRRFAEGKYDEYFAVAYEQAVSSAAGEDDPLVAASTKGATVAPWDFTVDTFESIEEQGVVKDNILAAGALDYIFELGERLGIYRLVDALTLNWAAGAIDVVDGPCAAKLYRYWKLRDQRMDPVERGLVYKRVLNKGDVEALDRMVVNENFEALWGTLCEKVAEYRAKVEDAKVEQGDTVLVSKTPIYQAVRDLQYNLTEFSTGMAHMQVREMYSQLREAMDLLGDPEIVDHFAGGRRKTMWTAIERLAKSEYGEAPNINAIRIAAVEGNTMFRFIAGFQQGSVAEEDFHRFIDAAEAWIIAKGSDTTDLLLGDEEEDEEDVEADEEIDFADEDI